MTERLRTDLHQGEILEFILKQIAVTEYNLQGRKIVEFLDL